ncbi:MAG: DUF1566 domain-containing protein [Candidatus Electrothrix sp. GM3_4]|nr:DUF1566 domain-containing protein [Candidatus Electrothrix sp. GM3_4]
MKKTHPFSLKRSIATILLTLLSHGAISTLLWLVPASTASAGTGTGALPAVYMLLLNKNSAEEASRPYPIVDTGVTDSYNNSEIISAPLEGEDFYGQDGTYTGNQPSYTVNDDGTVTDTITGLMWQQDMGEQMTWSEVNALVASFDLGEYTDWRLPTIKELYSLILFTGANGDGENEETYTLYLDTTSFLQPFGDTSSGQRLIDAQTWSGTEYVGTTMNGDATVFGVNFIDGRIKGYPKYEPSTQQERKAYFRLVRGNTNYGKNNFMDNEDGTISDLATGLMWQQADEGLALDWQDALASC